MKLANTVGTVHALDRGLEENRASRCGRRAIHGGGTVRGRRTVHGRRVLCGRRTVHGGVEGGRGLVVVAAVPLVDGGDW